MRIVITIACGLEEGRKLWLESGQVAEVGSGEFVDLALPGDDQIAPRHFSLECGSKGCRLRNLSHIGGTFVNGQPQASAWLADGDEIVAGRTRMTVGIEGATLDPSTASEVPTVASAAQIQQRLLEYLTGLSEPLFALLDAARDPLVYSLLVRSSCETQSLYEGVQGAALAVVAPHLVRLPANADLVQALVRHGWGNSWGIFLTSQHSLAEVRRHFRRFLMVDTDDGREMYFRFYDPRVLRRFLPTCLPDEAQRFFGPVSAFYAEDEDAQRLLWFSAAAAGESEMVSLSSTQAALGTVQ